MGCSTIDFSHREHWPQMTIQEHYLSYQEMTNICSKYTLLPLACAEWEGTKCDIYYWKAFAPQFIKEHERAHCLGYKDEYYSRNW